MSVNNPFNKPLSLEEMKDALKMPDAANNPKVIPSTEEMAKALDVNPPKISDPEFSTGGINVPTPQIDISEPKEPVVPVLSKNTESKHEDAHGETCAEILKAYNNMESDIPLSSNYWNLKTQETIKNRRSHGQ